MTIRIVLIAAVVLLSSRASAQSVCCGDCDGDFVVRIPELITGVRNAQLGCQTAPCCGACTLPDTVRIDDLLTGVNNALTGCPGASICGGQVTSAPRVCHYTVQPPTFRRGQPATIQYCVSDLEGDVTSVFITATRPYSSSVSWWFRSFPPGLLNECFEEPLRLESLEPTGSYVTCLSVNALAGDRSNEDCTTFTLLP